MTDCRHLVYGVDVLTTTRSGQMQKEHANNAGLDHFNIMERRRIGSQPLPNGDQTGRNAKGQFVRGCVGGPGNPNAASVSRNRARLYEVVRTADIDLAIKTMRDVMRNGKDSDRLAAARLLLDRALGPIAAVDLDERLTQAEQLLAAAIQHESK